MIAKDSITDSIQELIDLQMSKQELKYGDISDSSIWQELMLLRSVAQSSEWAMLERYPDASKNDKIVNCFRNAFNEAAILKWLDMVVSLGAFREARAALTSVIRLQAIVATLGCPEPSEEQTTTWKKALTRRISEDHLQKSHRSIYVLFMNYQPSDDRSMDSLRAEAINYLLR
jgi:hypothetical protein